MKINKKDIHERIKITGERFGFDLPYFIKNGFWVLFGQFFEILVGIGLSVVFARFLTKEVFGQYNFVLSIITLLSILSVPGLNSSLIRSVARGYDGVYRKAVRLSFLWSLTGVPLMILIGAYYYFFDNSLIGIALFLSALVFPFYYAPNTWKAFLVGKSKFDVRAIYSAIQALVNSGFIVLFIFLGEGSLLSVFLANILSNTALNVLFYTISLRFVRNKSDDRIWKKGGYKLSITTFVSNIYNYLDKLLIGIMLGNAELAVYSIATAIAGRLISQQRQLLAIVKPKLFQKGRYARGLRQAPKLFFISSLFAVLVIMALPFVMDLLYGEKYAESIPYAQVYMLCFPIGSLNVLFSTLLVSAGRENVLIKVRIIMLIINVVLYFLLIPLMGIYGAVLASIMYYISNAGLMYYYVKRNN